MVFEMKAHADLLSWLDWTWQIRQGSSPITLPFDGIFAASSKNDASPPSTQPSLMQQIPSRRSSVVHRYIKATPNLMPNVRTGQHPEHRLSETGKGTPRPPGQKCLRRNFPLHQLPRTRASRIITILLARITHCTHRTGQRRVFRSRFMPPAAAQRHR